MISYFKHTDGSAFTLDGLNYRGMVNVQDSVYSGSTKTNDSSVLSASPTFYTSCVQNKLNFNHTSVSSPSDTLSISQIYPRTTLNINNLNSILNDISLNNSKIFASETTYNQNYFNVLMRSYDKQSLTYCLSSLLSSTSMTGRTLPLYRLPAPEEFKIARGVSVNGSSIFISQSSNNYKYFNNGRVIEGYIGSSSAPSISEGISAPSFDHKHIHHDKYNNLLYYTSETQFTIYNFNFSIDNNTLTVVDSIDRTTLNTPLNLYSSAYGKRYRSTITIFQGNLFLEIYPTKSAEMLKQYTPDDLNLDTFITVCQRFEDDVLCVYGTRGDNIILQTYDISNLIYTPIMETEGVVVGGSINDILEFSPFDSDVIFIKKYNADNSIKSFEFRSISAPSYPLVSFTDDFGFTMGFMVVNEQIDTIDTVIDNVYIPLGIRNLSSNTSKIYDIKFSVNDSVNCIVMFEDSFTIINTDLITSIVPLDLSNKYESQSIYNNSIGLALNDSFKNLIIDTFTLYFHSNKKLQFVNNIPRNYYPTFLKDIDTTNLYIYDNESINVSVLNRVLNKLTSIQQQLAGTITTPQ